MNASTVQSERMKRLAILLPIIAIPSCASMMNKHRMKAAERKMLTASHLQQTEHWDEAIDMVQRMQSSVSKSITPIPVQKSASGLHRVPRLAGAHASAGERDSLNCPLTGG